MPPGFSKRMSLTPYLINLMQVDFSSSIFTATIALLAIVGFEIKNFDKPPTKTLVHDTDEKYLADHKLIRIGKKLRYQFETIRKLNKKITPKEIINARKQFRNVIVARNIYTEVLNVIQPIVISKLKITKGKENKKNLNDALLTSIAGISAAMKNTG